MEELAKSADEGEEDNCEDDNDFNDDESIGEVDNDDEDNDCTKDNDDSESNDGVDAESVDVRQQPAQYIKVPLQLGQINIEDILKFPGVQVQLLDYEKVPKQNYNLFIAESILSRNLGVSNDRGVFTADLIAKGAIVERVVGKEQPYNARGDRTYVIRCKQRKIDYETMDWNKRLPHCFMALANDPLGVVPPNVELFYEKKSKGLAFRTLREITAGEELSWEYTDDGGYWLPMMKKLPERVREQCLICYGHRKDFKEQNKLIVKEQKKIISAPEKRISKQQHITAENITNDQQVLKDAFNRVFNTLNPDDPLFVDIVESVMKRKLEIDKCEVDTNEVDNNDIVSDSEDEAIIILGDGTESDMDDNESEGDDEREDEDEDENESEDEDESEDE